MTGAMRAWIIIAGCVYYHYHIYNRGSNKNITKQ